jgi:hypothetical protein
MERTLIEQALEALKGTTFIGLDTETVPALKGGKKNPFQGKIKKLCKGHQVILYGTPGYETKVKRHLIAEGKDPESFKAGGLPWGQHIPGTSFLEHKGELYLQCVFLNAANHIEYQATSEIVLEGAIAGHWRYGEGENIPKENIPGLPVHSGSEHQGLDKQVIVRAYKISSITGLRAFGNELV